MPDKLTDKEIVKALENEIHLAEYVDSDYCSNTEVSLLKSTLDLINRTKANENHYRQKVQDQKQELKRLNEVVNRLQAENERLIEENSNLTVEFQAMRNAANGFKKQADEYAYLFDKHISTPINHFKSEAYKEFADKVKEKAYTECDITGYKYQVVQIEEIDNLLKELVGDK